MTEIKSPAILNRISRFILIQIVFIFTALALVLFYNSDGSKLSSHYNNLRNDINQIADQLHQKLSSSPDIPPDDPEIIGLIDKIKTDREFISHIKLVPRAYIPEPAPRTEFVTLPPPEEAVMPAPPLLAALSEDNESVVFTIQPESENVGYAVQITSTNILTVAFTVLDLGFDIASADTSSGEKCQASTGPFGRGI